MRLERHVGPALLAAALAATAFVWATPFLWTLVASFRPEGAGNADMASLLPDLHPTLANFRNALESGSFGLYYVNTIIVVMGVLAVQCVTVSLAGYAFARLRFRGSTVLFLLILFTLVIPFEITMIPTFIIMDKLGLQNTLAALILPALVTPLGVFLMRQFFVNLPREVEEAAQIDGCSRLGVLRHVALPLAVPALSTLAALTFLTAWNELLWPLIVISSEAKSTLPLGLTTFQGQHTQDLSAIMAGDVITTVPVLLAFLLAQRTFIQSLTSSAVKG